jgi:hypothetical protein
MGYPRGYYDDSEDIAEEKRIVEENRKADLWTTWFIVISLVVFACYCYMKQ